MLCMGKAWATVPLDRESVNLYPDVMNTSKGINTLCLPILKFSARS